MFCPGCGTAHSPGAAFCEHCGERLAPEQTPPPAPAATAAIPAPAPATLAAGIPAPASAPGAGRRGPRSWLLFVAAAVAAVAAVVAVLALTGAFSGDDGPASVARTVTPSRTVAAPAISEPEISTETTPAPAPTTTTAPEPAAPRSVGATVSRTCGRNGVGGDCHLSVRARPSSGSGELERLDEGDGLRLSCQVRGEAVRSSALGASSTVWSRTTRGGYVSNVYVTGPRLKAQAMTLQPC